MKDGKMSRSEAGRLGWEKSEEKNRIRYKKFRDEYEKCPKICGDCGTPLPYEKRRHLFCNHSCAAKKNNQGVRRNGRQPGKCLYCGERLQLSSRKFCNIQCQKEHSYQEYIKKWLSGKVTGLTNHGLSISNHIKRWLVDTYGRECSVCGGTEWMGGTMPLTVDHEDGSYKNNRPKNLRLVCGNCGMQLPTFAGRNRGNGRLARKQWDDKLAAVMSS